MVTHTSMSPRLQLGRVVREAFLAELVLMLDELAAVVQVRLNEVLDEATNIRDSQTRRDIWMAYKTARARWVEKTAQAWRQHLSQGGEANPLGDLGAEGMTLQDAGVLENKIYASRLAIAVNECVLGEFDDLRVRMRALENLEDLGGRDLFRVEVLSLILVEQWGLAGMSVESWQPVSAAVERVLMERLLPAYKNANAMLVAKGVLPVIALNDRVKLRPRMGDSARSPVQGGGDTDPLGLRTERGGEGRTSAHSTSAMGSGWASSSGMAAGPGAGARTRSGAPAQGGGSGFAGQTERGGGASTGSGAGTSSGAAPFWRTAPSERHGLAHSTADETRMLTSTSPLARARSRAQGVFSQIRRLFASGVGGEYVSTAQQPPSPALVQAISPQVVAQNYADGGTLYQDYSPAGVARVAEDLRERSVELKKKAETKGEKAIIEIVALMFQAILAEERIPPGIRVWFARLQMPVLRVALEDPDFLGATDHPARALIDRMGSCVMGFEASGVQGAAMEAEVKRIVQVVEQYPETGKKVYQIVYDEFQKFLSKFLTEKGPTKKVVSVALQVEQKETLAIQYTIELRNMLKGMPVRDEIRDFLYKVWAEVLAVSALRQGAKHPDTLSLKACATDLVWAASAKPSRADRTRVIQDLPHMLQRLRSGMSMLALPADEQEAHVKKISDTLADAFLSKTQAIPQAKIDAMARRLAALEDFVSEDGMGDLPLDSESLEMMLGIDAAPIEVINTGGSRPNAAMLAWAAELQPGTWFTLDYNHQKLPVQLAWHSERRHLNLFAAISGRSFLLQGGRLAAYLQSGLLVPQEEETLTVRATRDALAKLEANPERLLS